MRRDAHRRYVSILTRPPGGERQLRVNIKDWDTKFDKGDVEAGYFLVEAYAKVSQQGSR